MGVVSLAFPFSTSFVLRAPALDFTSSTAVPLTPLTPADIPTFQSHVVRLARAGMQPVVNGSMGEAHHLEPQERVALIRAAREALDAAGLADTVIIGGT